VGPGVTLDATGSVLEGAGFASSEVPQALMSKAKHTLAAKGLNLVMICI
jgi:hypothetical protein